MDMPSIIKSEDSYISIDSNPLNSLDYSINIYQ